MTSPNDREMPQIECRNLRHIQSLGEGDDRGIARAQGKIRVPDHQVGHTIEVWRGQIVDDEVALCERSQKAGFSTSAAELSEQISDLSNYWSRNNHLPIGEVHARKQFDGPMMVGIP